MATPKQIVANQQNSQQSTGPRTAAGKAVASRNALVHGLFAETAVIPGEDSDAFKAFRAALLQELQPRGMAQRLLAERIVTLWWKSRRIPRMEAQLVKLLMDRQDESQRTGNDRDRAAAVMADDLTQRSSAVVKLQMHELRIERAIRVAMKELGDLQNAAADIAEDLEEDLVEESDEEPATSVAMSESWRNEANSVATIGAADGSAGVDPPQTGRAMEAVA